MEVQSCGFSDVSNNGRFGIFGTWRALIFLVTISISQSHSKPFLLINKGEINIHDSVQRVGHAHYKSTGGRVRYLNLGAEDTPLSRQGKSLGAGLESNHNPTYPHGMNIHADSYAVIPHDNVKTKIQGGFQPSRQFHYAPQKRQQFSGEQIEHDAQDMYVGAASTQMNTYSTSTTGGYAHANLQPMNNDYQLPPSNYHHGVYNGNAAAPYAPMGYGHDLHHQNDAVRTNQYHQLLPQGGQSKKKNGLKKFLVGIHGKVNKAIKSVKKVFRSIMYKTQPRNVRPPAPIQKRIEYNRNRSNLFGIDLWNLDSPLGRFVKWFDNLTNQNNKI